MHGCAISVNADGGYRLAGECLNFFGDDLLQRVCGVEVVVQDPVLRALFEVATLKLAVHAHRNAACLPEQGCARAVAARFA